MSGDYDGDRKSDPAIYQSATPLREDATAGQAGNWTVLLSAGAYITATLWGFGGSGYAMAVGDFDGDGKADPAIYQASTYTWYVKLSASGYATASASQ